MSLSTLPPELLTNIINQVDRTSLPTLRLVSRDVHAISTPRFGRTCLADLAFIFSEYSLQHLVDLTESDLARYVKKIAFGTHVLKVKTAEELAWERWGVGRDAEEELTDGDLDELDRAMAAVESGDDDDDFDGDEDDEDVDGVDGEAHPYAFQEVISMAGRDFRTSIAGANPLQDYHGNSDSDSLSDSDSDSDSNDSIDRESNIDSDSDDEDSDSRNENPYKAIDDEYRLKNLPPQDSDEFKAMAKAVIAFQRKAYAMTRFLDSNRHIDLMTQAFKNLKKRNNINVTLGFIDDAVTVDKENKPTWTMGRKCHGFDEFYAGRLNHSMKTPMNPDYRRVMPDLIFRSMLKATTAADYPVNTLHLDLVEWKSYPLSDQGGVGIPLERWLFEPRQRPYTENALTLTPGLEWKVNAMLHDNILTTLHISTTSRKLSFASTDLTAQANNKHHTKWDIAHFGGLHDYGIYAWPLGDHVFRSLSFTTCSLDIIQICEFLRSQRSSLRTLNFTHVDLDFEEQLEEHAAIETAKSFLKLLRDELELESLTMIGMRSADTRYRFVGGSESLWTNRQEIQDGLAEDIQREERRRFEVDTELLMRMGQTGGWSDEDEEDDDDDDDDDGYLPAPEVPRNMVHQYQIHRYLQD